VVWPLSGGACHLLILLSRVFWGSVEMCEMNAIFTIVSNHVRLRLDGYCMMSHLNLAPREFWGSVEMCEMHTILLIVPNHIGLIRNWERTVVYLNLVSRMFRSSVKMCKMNMFLLCMSLHVVWGGHVGFFELLAKYGAESEFLMMR
jgi:hypothetical protein